MKDGGTRERQLMRGEREERWENGETREKRKRKDIILDFFFFLVIVKQKCPI